MDDERIIRAARTRAVAMDLQESMERHGLIPPDADKHRQTIEIMSFLSAVTAAYVDQFYGEDADHYFDVFCDAARNSLDAVQAVTERHSH